MTHYLCTHHGTHNKLVNTFKTSSSSQDQLKGEHQKMARSYSYSFSHSCGSSDGGISGISHVGGIGGDHHSVCKEKGLQK